MRIPALPIASSGGSGFCAGCNGSSRRRSSVYSPTAPPPLPAVQLPPQCPGRDPLLHPLPWRQRRRSAAVLALPRPAVDGSVTALKEACLAQAVPMEPVCWTGGHGSGPLHRRKAALALPPSVVVTRPHESWSDYERAAAPGEHAAPLAAFGHTTELTPAKALALPGRADPRRTRESWPHGAAPPRKDGCVRRLRHRDGRWQAAPQATSSCAQRQQPVMPRSEESAQRAESVWRGRVGPHADARASSDHPQPCAHKCDYLASSANRSSL
mmetsp:Transcript_18753/g.41108  ORF Transcript_18753/g.41108 Transcript_18753/m.41108 type:complete len:269 (-) Transcript_18753:824-1630(-)